MKQYLCVNYNESQAKSVSFSQDCECGLKIWEICIKMVHSGLLLKHIPDKVVYNLVSFHYIYICPVFSLLNVLMAQMY